MYGMVSGHSSAKHSRRHQIQAVQQQQQQTGDDSCDNGDHKHKSLYRRLMGCIRQTWSGVKMSMDSEFDDLDNPVYRRPSKGLEHLVSTTRFTRAELKRLYRGFKAECPTGLVKEETFRNMYSQFFPKGASTTSQYPKYVFNSLAQDNSGLLGFEDLVLALSDLCRGTADEKLRWAFHIYDVDGDGVISRTELEDVVTSVSELTGDTDVLIESTAVQIWIERVFEKMDLDGDGVISREEFFTACLQDEQIRRSLSIFDDIVL